jgi:hypothetical protein
MVSPSSIRIVFGFEATVFLTYVAALVRPRADVPVGTLSVK